MAGDEMSRWPNHRMVTASGAGTVQYTYTYIASSGIGDVADVAGPMGLEIAIGEAQPRQDRRSGQWFIAFCAQHGRAWCCPDHRVE